VRREVHTAGCLGTLAATYDAFSGESLPTGCIKWQAHDLRLAADCRRWGEDADESRRVIVLDKLRLLDRAVTACTNSIVITTRASPDDPIVYVIPAFERTTATRPRK
jgi:hypothetical protein